MVSSSYTPHAYIIEKSQMHYMSLRFTLSHQHKFEAGMVTTISSGPFTLRLLIVLALPYFSSIKCTSVYLRLVGYFERYTWINRGGKGWITRTILVLLLWPLHASYCVVVSILPAFDATYIYVALTKIMYSEALLFMSDKSSLLSCAM